MRSDIFLGKKPEEGKAGSGGTEKNPISHEVIDNHLSRVWVCRASDSTLSTFLRV